MSHALQLLTTSGALLEGHFRLSSGLHADRYFQCARAFVDPTVGAELVGLLVRQHPLGDFPMIVGPALGGVLVAYELARQLGVRNCFAERDGGRMQLRRGFDIPPGTSVLVAEDVVTTGQSSREVIEVLEAHGAVVGGVACLVDRSAGGATQTLGRPVWSLLQVEVPTWSAEACPLCATGVPVVKPGSRPLEI